MNVTAVCGSQRVFCHLELLAAAFPPRPRSWSRILSGKCPFCAVFWRGTLTFGRSGKSTAVCWSACLTAFGLWPSASAGTADFLVSLFCGWFALFDSVWEWHFETASNIAWAYEDRRVPLRRSSDGWPRECFWGSRVCNTFRNPITFGFNWNDFIKFNEIFTGSFSCESARIFVEIEWRQLWWNSVNYSEINFLWGFIGTKYDCRIPFDLSRWASGMRGIVCLFVWLKN
jgi:hypothetical protein